MKYTFVQLPQLIAVQKTVSLKKDIKNIYLVPVKITDFYYYYIFRNFKSCYFTWTILSKAYKWTWEFHQMFQICVLDDHVSWISFEGIKKSNNVIKTKTKMKSK